jgi:hypothetical protein
MPVRAVNKKSSNAFTQITFFQSPLRQKIFNRAIAGRLPPDHEFQPTISAL